MDYCFLEVLPPFIEEGITNALKCDLNELTLVPYFLYPGKKVKAAVTSVMAMQKNTKTKFLVMCPNDYPYSIIGLSIFSAIPLIVSSNSWYVGLCAFMKLIVY